MQKKKNIKKKEKRSLKKFREQYNEKRFYDSRITDGIDGREILSYDVGNYKFYVW